MSESMVKAKGKPNWWMIYSLILSGLITLAMFLPQWLMKPGRDDAMSASGQLLTLAGKRDFDLMSKFASQEVVDFMKERDKQWGKVVSFAFEDSVVQIGGSPAEVRYRVWRERKNVREQFTCIGKRVVVASVIWPPAEEK